MCISSLVSESLHLILFLCTVRMLMFEGILKIYSGYAAIFSYLDLKKCYFHKFYYFSDHVYFQLPWFR